jgi:ABC-type bacteriocin/lantibiotic exporter with double-glycine peptidase domain
VLLGRELLKMKEYILQYKEKLEKQLENPNISYAELKRLKAYHEKHIEFFQHERLIHFIVTFLFAILTVLAIGVVIFAFSFPLLLLALILLVMTLTYVIHYYFLENSVQEFYKTYDKICGMIENNEAHVRSYHKSNNKT